MTQALMALTARFDVNQIDDGIDWLFADIESLGTTEHGPACPEWNRDIAFSVGQTFRIAITASDKDRTGFESFDIVDCCLVTRPRILSCGPGERTWYAPPSLFAGPEGTQLGAVVQIDPAAFSVLGTGGDPGQGKRVTQLWNDQLTVGPYNGAWELSFYLTVRIRRAGEEQAQLRVFWFDPETEVGNGTYPPR